MEYLQYVHVNNDVVQNHSTIFIPFLSLLMINLSFFSSSTGHTTISRRMNISFSP